jgi:hypothetical protein
VNVKNGEPGGSKRKWRKIDIQDSSIDPLK